MRKLLQAVGSSTLIVTGSLLAAAASAQQIEEITVTARKTEESLSDAPLAISAVSEDTINAAFLGDTRGITSFAPNLVFDEIPTGTVGGGGIAIRGISFQDVEKSFDPVVLIHVDGVPVGHNSANVMNLLDVERIEVLRGPQGTLFGKNSVGGAINVIRKKPTTVGVAGKLRMRLEDGDSPALEGVFNVPLSETFAAKINLSYVETPGYYENATTGQDLGEADDKRIGVHLLWAPTDSFSAEFQYNSFDYDGLTTPTLQTSGPTVTFCAAFGACGQGGTPFSGDRTSPSGEGRFDFDVQSDSYQFNVDWGINDALSGILIAAHSDMEEEQFLDTDDVPFNLFSIRRSNDYQQTSIEARLDFDNGGLLRGTVGYFYWDADLDNWQNDVVANVLFGLPPGTCTFDRAQVCQSGDATYGSSSDSLFFEGDVRLNDRVSLILGARYIEETKKIALTSGNPIFGLVTLPLTTGEREDDDLIYRLGARYEATDDLMFYATYSTGFRSGGFSIRAGAPEFLLPGYSPETIKNLEGGVKGTFFDRRVRAAVTLFHMSYEDMQQELQIARPTGTQSTVINAAEATLQGIELETTALLSETLSLDFNLGLLDAEYDEFVGQAFEDTDQFTDNSNLDLRRAPDVTYTVALNYDQELTVGRLRGRVAYNWRDDYEGSVTNFPGTQIDSFGLLDASLTYSRDNWSVGIFGRNLTDEDEYSHNFVVAPFTTGAALWTFASPRPPRTFGVEFTYNFNDY